MQASGKDSVGVSAQVSEGKTFTVDRNFASQIPLALDSRAESKAFETSRLFRSTQNGEDLGLLDKITLTLVRGVDSNNVTKAYATITWLSTSYGWTTFSPNVPNAGLRRVVRMLSFTFDPAHPNNPPVVGYPFDWQLPELVEIHCGDKAVPSKLFRVEMNNPQIYDVVKFFDFEAVSGSQNTFYKCKP